MSTRCQVKVVQKGLVMRDMKRVGARHQFWKNPTFDKLVLVEKGINVTRMTGTQVYEKAKQIEKKDREECCSVEEDESSIEVATWLVQRTSKTQPRSSWH